MPTEDADAAKQWTIMRLLRWTADYFSGHGIDTPRIDAEVLLAHCLGLSRIDLYLRHDQPLEQGELARFRELVRRRARREPVAYITGGKEFWSLELQVSPHVLIPRPETELLVEQALEVMGPRKEAVALELGTGTGAISLALASQRPGWWIAASDISPEAVALARANAVKHGLEGRVSFFVSDWLAAVATTEPQFDLIVSNPPYIRSREIGRLEPEISSYEPRLALDGGVSGLECLTRIISAAGPCLKAGGFILLEIGHDQKDAAESLFRDRGVYHQVTTVRDYGGSWRVVMGRKKDAG